MQDVKTSFLRKRWTQSCCNILVSVREKRNVTGNELSFFQWHVILKITAETLWDLTFLGCGVLSLHRFFLSTWKNWFMVYFNPCSTEHHVQFRAWRMPTTSNVHTCTHWRIPRTQGHLHRLPCHGVRCSWEPSPPCYSHHWREDAGLVCLQT